MDTHEITETSKLAFDDEMALRQIPYTMEEVDKWLEKLEALDLDDCEKPSKNLLGVIKRVFTSTPVVFIPGEKGSGISHRRASEYFETWQQFFSKVYRAFLLTAALSKEIGAEHASVEFVDCLHYFERLKKSVSFKMSEDEMKNFLAQVDVAYNKLWAEVEYMHLPSLDEILKPKKTIKKPKKSKKA